MAVNKKRWQSAQTYEKDWWEKQIEDIDLDYLRSYAAHLSHHTAPFLQIGKETKILEIGSGPAGVLTFLNADQKFAIEPLESFFASVPKCAAIRDERVQYVQGMAEELPWQNNMFDLIIIDNVLDHCQNVDAVFAEMQRVLRSGGIVYLRLNLYNIWGLIVRYFAEIFQIDEGHPYSFTPARLERYYHKHGFVIKQKVSRGIMKTWLKQISSFKVKELAKALSFATPDTVTYILALRRDD